MFTRYEQNGLEFIIDESTGEAYTTLSAYSRMSGVSLDTLLDRVAKGSFEGVDLQAVKTAEVTTAAGLETVHLLPAETIFDLSFIDNLELARAMGRSGATLYIYGLVGY